MGHFQIITAKTTFGVGSIHVLLENEVEQFLWQAGEWAHDTDSCFTG